MRKLLTAALLGGFVSAFALPVLAQTTTGPQSCKANEVWDASTQKCVPK
jgi:hypothetical protein